VAAGSLMITEAGGLIGNFTGEADYLFQREVVAGTPKIYGQLVQMLSPYTRVIKADEPAAEGAAPAPEGTPEDALAASLNPEAAAPAEEKKKKGPVRIRKADAAGQA
jgi:myo-inositol-1(or 4)-monophosphatase